MLQITYGAPSYRLNLLRDMNVWTTKLHVIGLSRWFLCAINLLYSVNPHQWTFSLLWACLLLKIACLLPEIREIMTWEYGFGTKKCLPFLFYFSLSFFAFWPSLVSVGIWKLNGKDFHIGYSFIWSSPSVLFLFFPTNCGLSPGCMQRNLSQKESLTSHGNWLIRFPWMMLGFLWKLYLGKVLMSITYMSVQRSVETFTLGTCIILYSLISLPSFHDDVTM